ncbi:CTD kinase subunit gamma [Monosporozyma unispora]|nr:hypothetical protein C6P44_003039 [Kazachstania unispora]
MDSLEARLRFITVLKTLQKTLNVINISEITSNNSNTSTTANIPTNSFVAVSNDGSLSSSSTTPSTSSTMNSTGVFTLPQTSDTKYVNPIEFYLKNYKEHYEDFHQCLIDTMKKFNVLDRLPITIYYFKIINMLYYDINNEISLKILNEFMIPSLIEIATLILPENDVMSLTNLPLSEDLVNNLLNSGRISVIIPTDLQTQLRNLIEARKEFKQTILNTYDTTQLISHESGSGTIEFPTILNRMEMDRDRHKRSKETNWKVKRPSSSSSVNSTTSQLMLNPAEFKTQWNSINALTAEDLQEIKTLNSTAQESYLL